MTSVLLAPSIGHQRPRLLSVPAFRSTAGDEAVELCQSAGLFLDEWQQFVLRQSLGERADGRWVTPDVALVCSRQNGKSALLEARILAGLFVFDEGLIIFTAHEMKAASVVFERVEALIRRNPRLHARVANYSHSKGGEGIALHPTVEQRAKKQLGSEVKFMARTGGSGRSFSADCLLLDEAYNLPDHVMNAITPTLVARDNPQIWYTSSAVNQVEHPHGLTLARIRRRGIADELDPRLAYFEYSGDEKAYAAAAAESRDALLAFVGDRQVWAQANPGYGIRIGEDSLSDQLQRLGPAGYAAEHLSIGDWPEEPTDDVVALIEPSVWEELIDRQSVPVDPVAFGVHVAPGSKSAAVVVAARRSDGLFHVEVLANNGGVTWVTDFVKERVLRNYPCATVLDPASPAGALIVPLENAGVEVVKQTAAGYRQACEAFMTAATERTELLPHGGLRHQGDPRLSVAVANAATRRLQAGWVIDADASPVDVSPLIAGINAMHGLVEHEGSSTVNLW